MEENEILGQNLIKDNEIKQINSFDKLRKLQMILKEEIASKDIFFENRDKLIKKITTNSFDYIKERIAIQEIYNNNSCNKTDKKEKIKYEVVDTEEAAKIFSEINEPMRRLFFSFRKNNEITLKLIERCSQDNYEILSNFLCNFFYINSFKFF